jgi:hypothetical protein
MVDLNRQFFSAAGHVNFLTAKSLRGVNGEIFLGGGVNGGPFGLFFGGLRL